MTELLPCPFCGGEAELTGFDAPEFWVWCPNCKASTDAHTCKGGAIEAWNTRAERTCHDTKPQLPYFKCDVCGMADMGGREIWISDGFYRGQKPNYCPNCGAKVVSE